MIDVQNLKKSFLIKKKEDKFVDKIKSIIDFKKKNYQLKTVLNDINFKIDSGDTLGLLGKNGSGKTTLIKILSTLYKKSSGSVKINGKEVYDNPLETKKKIGVLYGGDVGLYSKYTAYENIEYFAKLNGLSDSDIKERVDKLSKYFHMEDYINRNVDNFSRGMKQKVCFVRTVIHKPEILILDEPSTGLDVESIKLVEDFIKFAQEENKTIIISSHNMNEINNLCNKLLILEDGNQKYFGDIEKVVINKNYDKLFELMGVKNG